MQTTTRLKNQSLKLTHPQLSGFCFTVARTQNFLFLVFAIPWEPSRSAQQGQDAMPWVSRVGVPGHNLGVSLCDTLGVGHVRHVTVVCVVTSLSLLSARLPWWRGWHRAPLPGTAPVLCSGTGRGHSCCGTRVACRLLWVSCIRRVGLAGVFPSRDDSLRWGGVPSQVQNFQK